MGKVSPLSTAEPMPGILVSNARPKSANDIPSSRAVQKQVRLLALTLRPQPLYFRPPTLTPDQSTSHKLLSTTLLKPLFRTGKLGLSGSLAPFVKKPSQYN